MSIANNLGSKPYLKGLLDIFKLLDDENGTNAKRYLRARVSSYMPNALGMADHSIEDETMKDVEAVKVPNGHQLTLLKKAQ